MINSEAPYLWDDLRGAINERAGKANAFAESEYFCAAPKVEGRTEHTLESSAGHLLLTFQHEVPIIKYKFTPTFKSPRETPKQVTGEIRFQVFDEHVWFVGGDGTQMSVSQAAAYFLEMHS